MSASTGSNNQSSSERSTALPFLLIAALLVAFFAAWPLISDPGFLNTRGGGDSPFLLQRLHQMEMALRDGHFPVRWMPDANYGFGYPFFNYYAPLSIYAAAFFHLLGFSAVRAIETAQIIGFLLAASGIYLLANHWFRHRWAALLASVAYTTAPFHLVNVYVRGDSLAEFWAMALYPWVILTADHLLSHRDQTFPYGRVAAFALAYAALILSHNISALIFTPFLLLFILLRWLIMSPGTQESTTPTFSMQRLRLLLPVLAAGLLALALAAWFFGPALVEQQFAQLGPVTEGYFSFANHFRGADLVQNSVAFNYDVAGGGAFRMGLVQAVAAILGSLALVYLSLRRREVDPASTLFILLTLAIATFLVTPLSGFLWEMIPLLPFTQFPWRFLSIQAFAASLAIGALALLPYCRVVSITTAVILIVASFAGLRTDHILLADEDITAESLAQYEWFTGNIGSTVSAEYLPQTVQPRFFTSAWLNTQARANARVLQGDLITAHQEERRVTRQIWLLDAAEGGATVVLPTMAWPGWQATIDEQPAELLPAPGSGHIMLDIPPGEHVVDLRLTRTAVRLIAELISLGALILIAIFVFKAGRPSTPGRPTLIITLVFLAFLLLFRFWPQPSLSAANLTWDFAQMAYLHHDQEGVPFSTGSTLLDYAYDKESVDAGQTVAITVRFTEANNDVVTLALSSPAITWPAFDPQAPHIAAQSKTLNSEQLTFELFIPQNAPSGLVIPRLTMDVGRPMMPSGRPRGDLFLRPLRITNAPPAASAGSTLDVWALDVRRRDPRTLDVQLAWSTGRQLSHNYNASLLLVDDAGNWLAQLDTQPGYGFLPSSEWLPGTAVNDWLAMPLPEELPQESPLALVARLYEVEGGAIVLTRRLGELTIQGEEVTFVKNQPVYDLPETLTPLAARFDDRIQLQGYDLQRESDTAWRLTLYWQALAPNGEDAIRFVHVIDPAQDAIILQNDSHPRANTYPVSQWTEGEIIADSLLLQFDDTQPGQFQIAVGFYRLDGDNQRLPAVDPASNETFSGDRVLLPATIKHYAHR